MKSHQSRSMAYEGMFRLLSCISFSSEDLKSKFWGPLMNGILPNKDKLSSNTASLDSLVDILSLIIKKDPNTVVPELPPFVEPPQTPDAFMAGVLAFVRLWDSLPEGEQVRHVGALKAWDSVSKAVGAPFFPDLDDLGPLVLQRKAHVMRHVLDGDIHVTNLVLHIGRLNRSICTAYETYSPVSTHLRTLPAGKVYSLSFLSLL